MQPTETSKHAPHATPTDAAPGSSLPGNDTPAEADEAALRQVILGRADASAAARVVEHVLPAVSAFLRGRFPALRPEDASDLAAEALVVAMERRSVFDPDRNTRVRTWLTGIARLRALDHFRRRGREIPLGDDDAPDGAESTGDHREPDEHRQSPLAAPATPTGLQSDRSLAEAIERAIRSLPRQQRRAAEAHFLDGRAPRDVDEAFGWRPNTANVYIAHARRAIRRELGAMGLGQGPERPTASYGARTRSPLGHGARALVRAHMARCRVRLVRGYAAVRSRTAALVA